MSMKRNLPQEYENSTMILEFQTNCQINMKEDKAFQCDNCGKRFKRVDTLKNHQNACNHEKYIQCTHEGCTETFSSRPALKYHLKKHENQIKFNCKYANCQKQFLTVGQLKQHYKTNVHQKQENRQQLIEQQQASTMPDITPNQSKILDNLWSYVLNVQIANHLDEQEQQAELNKFKNFVDQQSEEHFTPMERVKEELLLIVGLVEKLTQIEDQGIYKIEKIRTALALVNEYYKTTFDKAVLIKKKSEPKRFMEEEFFDDFVEETHEESTQDNTQYNYEENLQEPNFNVDISKYIKFEEDEQQEMRKIRSCNIEQNLINNECEEQNEFIYREIEDSEEISLESNFQQGIKFEQEEYENQENNNVFDFQEGFKQDNMFGLDMNARPNNFQINFNTNVEIVYN